MNLAAQPKPTTKKRVILFLKIAISVGLLGWVLHSAAKQEGFDALVHRVAGLAWDWIALATLLQFVPVLLGTWRWRVLLNAQGLEQLSWKWLLRLYFVGRFYAAFTPSTAGLDVFRAYAVGRKTGQTARSAAAIIVEKFVGLIGLALVCMALFTGRAREMLGTAGLLVALATAAGSSVGLVLLANASRVKPLLKIAPKFARSRLEKLLDAAEAPGLTIGVILAAIGIGFVAHFAMSSVFALTALSLGLTIDPLLGIVTGNVIIVATLLPISMAGVGVREGVAVVLLGQLGVSTADATLVALLGYLTGQVPAVIGGLWSLFPDPYGQPSPRLTPVDFRLY